MVTDKQFAEVIERFPIMAQWGRKGIEECAVILRDSSLEQRVADLERVLKQARHILVSVYPLVSQWPSRSIESAIGEANDALKEASHG